MFWQVPWVHLLTKILHPAIDLNIYLRPLWAECRAANHSIESLEEPDVQAPVQVLVPVVAWLLRGSHIEMWIVLE